MKLYNTASRIIENFKALSPPLVTFYSCGPTVYDYTHIGHLRTYTGNDILKRTLNYLGFKVKHVMNITDVGHLTEDCDAGEDKLEKGAKRTGKTVWEVAKFYTDFFIKSIDDLNITRPNILAKATDNVEEMIKLVETLKERGFTYETDEAIYFDVLKFKNYGKLSGQSLEEKKQAVRCDVYVDQKKKNPVDFALWFKCQGRFANHSMRWSSPWGTGFPGWHIECSAISMKYLGKTLDIHSGGVDHIPVHHENEIAQSEAVTDKKFVNYWVHFNFLLVDGKKMSKSLGNFYTLEDIKNHNINPLALRLLFLQSHYRQEMNFTWESVSAAHEAYKKLIEISLNLKKKGDNKDLKETKSIKDYRHKFTEALSNDLQTPQAIALMWKMLKSSLSEIDKYCLLIEFNKVLGLGLDQIEKTQIPQKIINLAEERQKARKNKDFKKADEIRNQIQSKKYSIEDKDSNFEIKKI